MDDVQWASASGGLRGGPVERLPPTRVAAHRHEDRRAVVA
jgi:hypothetical protein